MSEIQKVLNLIRGGGGRKFSKSSEIQKVLNYPRGGGSSLIGNFSQIFPFFFSDGSPKGQCKLSQSWTILLDYLR